MLAKQSLTKSTMSCLMDALVGINHEERIWHSKIHGCFPNWENINKLREDLGDHALTEINLSYNDLRVGGVRVLCDSLLRPSSWRLTCLRLDANELREEGCLALIPLFAASTSAYALTHLSIAKNSIGDKGVMKLLEALERNQQLLSLNIAGNSCSFRSARMLGRMLANNSTLKMLDCSYNTIRSDGAVALARGLAQNVVLAEINLSWNGFGNSEPCNELGAGECQQKSL